MLVLENDLVGVKCRGLPYSATHEEIEHLFQNYDILKDSIVFGERYNGQPNGFMTLLCNDIETARRAANEINKKYVGNRYVDTQLITYGDYHRFNK